jgi:hypothetical protein
MTDREREFVRELLHEFLLIQRLARSPTIKLEGKRISLARAVDTECEATAKAINDRLDGSVKW